MIVSDTTPLNYLILIDTVEILPRLYERIMIPTAVYRELSRPETPHKVKNWLQTHPDWLEVRKTSYPDSTPELDIGEQEAIGLAVELRANKILLDEKAARAVAKAHGLTVIGTLGSLEAAAIQHLIDLPEALQRLGQTNFHCAPRLIEALIERNHQRRKPEGNHP